MFFLFCFFTLTFYLLYIDLFFYLEETRLSGTKYSLKFYTLSHLKIRCYNAEFLRHKIYDFVKTGDRGKLLCR